MITFTDLHLRNESLAVCEKVLLELGERASKTKDKRIACLGDFLHERYDVPGDLVIMAKDVLDYWFKKEQVEEYIKLLGNHDENNPQGRSVLEIFDMHPKVKVISYPTWTPDGLWIPYRLDKEEIKTALKLKRPKGCSSVLWMHHGLFGAMLNDAKTNNESGLKEDEIPGKFKRIYLGHYHKYQVIGRAVYIGSPYQTTWAEAGQPKGYIETDGAKYEFVEWNIGPSHFNVDWDGHGKTPVPKGFRPGYDLIHVDCQLSQEEAMKENVQGKLKKVSDTLTMEFKPEVREEVRMVADPRESKEGLVDRFLESCELPDDIEPSGAKDRLFEWIKEEAA